MLWMAPVLLLTATLPTRAQDIDLFPSDTPDTPPVLFVEDLPNATTLPKGSGSLDMRIYAGGGLMSRIYAGVTERLTIGVSFGGNNILGSGKIGWNPHPGVALRYNVISRTSSRPALTVGFDSQGYGPYNDTLDRYQIKSPGFFAVAGHRIAVLGALDVVAGFNYSVENKDKDGRFNGFIGADKSINEQLAFLIEYDFARNDNRGLPGYGKNNGYLNMGVRATLGGTVGLEFDLRNLLDNRVGGPSPTRELKITYTRLLDF
jgi:hypothetical protein